MFEIKTNHLFVSDIAGYLGLQYIGNDIEVNQFTSSDNLIPNSFSYLESDAKISANMSECLLLCPINYVITNHNISYIRCENPELSFYTLVNEFYVEPQQYKLETSAKVADNTTLGVNINLGFNTFVGSNVQIGDSTYIGNNVIINSNISIGRNCYIKDGSIIGSEGFNFIQNENRLMHIPQTGKIIIEDNVWIGSNSVIERATLNSTLIKSGVKIDDLVQIGNSCVINTNTQIVSGCVVGAGVNVGSNCFIGMNVSIKENLTIGDNVIIGSGAAVITNINNDMVYAGVPAKRIVKREA